MYRYVATDEDGEVYKYEKMPGKDIDCWNADGSIALIGTSALAAEDWENSLVKIKDE